MRYPRLHLRLLLALMICVLRRAGTSTKTNIKQMTCSDRESIAVSRDSVTMRFYRRYESIGVFLRIETCCVNPFPDHYTSDEAMCYNFDKCIPNTMSVSEHETFCAKFNGSEFSHEWYTCNLAATHYGIGKICPHNTEEQWEVTMVFESLVSEYLIYIGICDHYGFCVASMIQKSFSLSKGRGPYVHTHSFKSSTMKNVDRIVVFYPIEDSFDLHSIALRSEGRSPDLFIESECRNTCRLGVGVSSFNARTCKYNESYYYMSLKDGCQRCRCPMSKCDPATGRHCLSEYCPVIKSDKYTQYWHELTMNQRNSTINCAKGTLVRYCASGRVAEWSVEIDNNCKTDTQLLYDVDTTVAKGNLSEDDIEKTVDNLDALAKISANNETISRKLLEIVGCLMKTDKNILAMADNKGKGGDKVRSILENFSYDLQISDGVSNVIAMSDVSVGAYSTISQTNKQFTIVTKFIEVTTSEQEKVISGPVVIIPSEITSKMKQENQNRIQVIAYRNSGLFNNNKSAQHRMSSAVITVMANISFALNLSHSGDAVIMYKIQRNTNDTGNFECVYWDAELRDWSSNGMAEVTDKVGDKLCQSTHLSSFSVLMDTDSSTKLSDEHERYLTYISYIGCGLSITGLLASIFTFALFKSLHGDNSGKIFLNICVSMLLLNTIFLLGSLDSDTYDVGICMAVAIFTHYFLLTTLVWMLIEALNMYQKLIIVFTKRNRWSMIIRMVAGWGMPLAVIGTTLAISTENYKPSNQFCFLTHANKVAFFAAVIAPASIILLINTFVFIRVLIIVLRQLRYGVEHTTSCQSSLSLAQVRGAMSVMIILGITWVFGPLAIGPAKVVFAYMFAILNSLQGFLLFFFRCFSNKEAMVSWKLFISTGRRKKKRGITTYTITSTDVKKSWNMSTTPSDSSLVSGTCDTFSGTHKTDNRHIILSRPGKDSSVSYIINSIDYAKESGECTNDARSKLSNNAEATLTDEKTIHYLRTVINEETLHPGKNLVKANLEAASSSKFSAKPSIEDRGTKSTRANNVPKC